MPLWAMPPPGCDSCENGGSRLRRWHDLLIEKYGLQKEMKDRKVIALPEGPWPRLPMTEDMLAARISEETYVTPRDVKEIFEVLATLAQNEMILTKKFTIPGLVTFQLGNKRKRKAETRIINGKQRFFAAKAQRAVVKAFPAKALKDFI